MNSIVEASLPNKSEKMSEWYSEVLDRAEIVDIRYGVKGFIVYRPFGMQIMKNIIRLYEEELEKTGHKPVLFPVVIPERNLRKEREHIKGFEGEVFWIEKAGYNPLEERLALRPTSETAMYPLYSLWIKSYKDLPFKAYQTVTVYRYETKATRPLLRGREFLWIEAHDVFTSEENARRQVLEDAEIFKKVTYEKLAIPFLHVKREEFDKFPGAVDSYAFDTLLPDGRVLQIGTTHYLGTKFSTVFEIVYHDRDGNRKFTHQTCFGIGLARILAALILIHGDEYGLILPFEVAPIQVVIIPIPKKGFDTRRINDYCHAIYNKLAKQGYRVIYDNSERSPGEKYYYYDMRGVPFRIEVGPKEVEGNFVTIFRRDIKIRERVEFDKIVEYISIKSKDILSNLRRRAEELLKNSIAEARDIDTLIKYVNERKPIIRVFFCGSKECSEKIKEITNGYETRGEPLNAKEKGNCIICGKDGSHITILAKAY